MKPKKIFIYVLPTILIVGLLSIFGFGAKTSDRHTIRIDLADKHRGVCWVGGPNIVTAEQMKALAEKHVNWISQTPFGWQSGHNNPQIGTSIGSDRVWWGERDEGLKITTQIARAHGIKTILKPHIWLRDRGGKWRGEIAMESEEDWKKWFADYEEFILHYARLAEEEKMEMLCIGTELHQTCVQREQDWRNLIKKIREVYSGDITYAANFSMEYEEIAFWDDLDYIGIQAYFPLTNQENPELSEVRRGWQSHLKELEAFSRLYNKPILFTEAGYKSTKNSGVEPWAWPERLSQEEREKIHSEKTQAVLYEAMFREVFNQPYIAGIHLWKWYPQRTTSQSRVRPFDIDFSPQGKMAEKVMIEWFGKFDQ